MICKIRVLAQLAIFISIRVVHGVGCCSQTFATCVSYCGTTQQDCQICADTSVVWLPNGVPPANTCIPRWSACTNNVNGCCSGLTCVGDQYWAGCQYVAPSPTAPPPTAAPIIPTAASVIPTTAPIKPTAAPIIPTAVPIVPTTAPIVPTAAPIKPTAAPIKPTVAPVIPTAAPVIPTAAPVIPTAAPAAPVIPTAAPVIPTAAPVKPTVAPIIPTAAPVAPTVAPIAPTSAPVQPTPVPVPPTQAPFTSSGGCCTQTFAICVSYCGTTQQQCSTCADTTVSWLPQGVPPPNSCIARWNACTNNVNGCCPGLTCVGDQNYAGCQYVSTPTVPTPTPPVAPTIAPIPPTNQPTIAPILVPTIAPAPVPIAPTPVPIAPTPAPIAPTSPPVPTIPSLLFSTSSTSTTWAVFQALSSLTGINSVNPPVYAYLSSGGAAGSGSVVSEGQGYSLLITGTVLASWNTHAQGRTASDRNQVLTAFYGYFNGWKLMCQRSSAPCQSGKLCQDASGTASICLPDWKFDSAFSSPQGTGSAPDGEEDAIVGMILAVKAVANDSPRPVWYDEVRKWADASATAFLTYDTLGNDPSAPNQRIVKLGSCWGGWGSNGQNPSYHAPGAYKLMRDYQASFPNGDRYTPATFTTSDWNALIQTTYKFLLGVQCPAQGMVPNWAVVTYVSSTGTVTSTGGSFSGSGTPQYEFGAEASRTIWRVALDAALYPNQATGSGLTAGAFLAPLLKQLQTGYAPSSPPYNWLASTFTSCSAPNTSSNIYIFSGGWINNAFIYAPIISSLIVPLNTLTAAQQQQMINSAGTALQTNIPTDYYARSWTLLSSLMINGAVASAGVTALN